MVTVQLELAPCWLSLYLTSYIIGWEVNHGLLASTRREGSIYGIPQYGPQERSRQIVTRRGIQTAVLVPIEDCAA